MQCNWKRSKSRNVSNAIVFECGVCNLRIGISPQLLDKKYGGDLQKFLDSKPDCKGAEAKEENKERFEKKPCRDEDGDEGITWDKTKRWLSAVKKWTLAGFPIRSLEEIEEVYNNKCIVCDHVSKQGSCKICGCKISKLRIALLNKIRMATEHCPIEEW